MKFSIVIKKTSVFFTLVVDQQY